MEKNIKELDFKDKARYQDFCFTSYDVEEPKYDEKICNYMVYQQEKCPTTGKLHYQGYVEFKSKTSINRMQKMIGCKCRCAVRGGTNQQASDYCKKEDTRVSENFTEIGIMKLQGRRSELDAIWDCIEDGMTAKEICYEHKGKALRVINMIIRGLEVEWDCCAIDKVILADRRAKQALKDQEEAEALKSGSLLADAIPPSSHCVDVLPQDQILEKCPEVSGNTNTHDRAKIDIEKYYYMKKDLEKLMKVKQAKFKGKVSRERRPSAPKK